METRTFLEICNDVAIQLRFDPIQSVSGNTDKNAVFVSLAVRQGLRRDVFWAHPWAILRREGGVAYQTNLAHYLLPSDFDHILNDTAWDAIRKLPAIGPLDPFEWEILKRSGDGPKVDAVAFTIAGPPAVSFGTVGPTSYRSYIHIDPVPTAKSSGPGMTYAYISEEIVVSSAGVRKNDFTADSDVPVLDASLVEHAGYVRGLRMLGLGFADEMRELQAAIKVVARRDGGRARMSASGGRGKILLSNTPGYGRARRR